jgi:mycoredoxin
MIVSGLVVSGASLLAGSYGSGFGLLAFFLLAAVPVSPWPFPHAMTDDAARAASDGDGQPIVYWRPGCPYCIRLRARLGRDARRLHWVDIWADPDGAASVREVTGGDETVPTVVAADRSFINPDVALVRGLLQPV